MTSVLDIVRREAIWFEPTPDGLRPLIDAIGNAPLVSASRRRTLESAKNELRRPYGRSKVTHGKH